jgi:alpha-tubulin suppressor-like RCC1 family protein
VQWGADGRVIVTDIKRPGQVGLKQMAAGSSFDLGLAADGSVWMWSLASRPSQVQGLSGIRQIAAAGDWSLALGADGRVWVWGGSTNQRTHIAPHVFETKSIAAGFDFYLLVGVDGSIAVGTWPVDGQLPADPIVHRDVAARSAVIGDMHVAILKVTGEVAVAEVAIDGGGVHLGTFGDVPGLSGTDMVAAGESGYLALRGDGTVWGARWGRPPVQVKDVAGARAVSASGDGYAVLLGDGSVRGIAIDEPGVHIWGDPHVDQADSIAGGSVALRADGTVYTYSRTVGAGQVTEILDGIAVAAGASQDLVLRADGTVWRWRAVGQ